MARVYHCDLVVTKIAHFDMVTSDSGFYYHEHSMHYAFMTLDHRIWKVSAGSMQLAAGQCVSQIKKRLIIT